MFGRFFAFEMGCPNEDTYQDAPQGEVMSLEEIQAQMQQDQSQDQGADTSTLICECKGLGCNKCKRKKAKVITLTGNPNIPLPVMNMPVGPLGPSMIMMGRPGMF